MQTSSKKFRPFVYIILALGIIVAISIALIYGELFEEIDQETTGAPAPAPLEKIEPGQATP